ncbi:hypothetical protein PAAG_05219 [Paracoccidioides lutzii Pb01]|uniref:Uncharacterized protein n=1 Tax=Paracoccidioides lutzii (strain ATCC MYA-826 / Pb01) TaxID=502779 RepID=C1H376_PARBA|nr:hypothetical protein PAAG_05219 [Paracoccidioides lutzii Pb01]EEH34170.2 hypothetical protein PAAG_05219 [Paracoccidioides lutzii Pb01]
MDESRGVPVDRVYPHFTAVFSAKSAWPRLIVAALGVGYGERGTGKGDRVSELRVLLRPPKTLEGTKDRGLTPARPCLI